MKYDEVPKNYHSPYMAQIADKLSILKMTKDERNNYSYYQKKLYNDRDELQAAEARGKNEGKIEIAKKLLAQEIDVKTISIATSLSIAEIEKLKS
jgi:predicted transposase/invertase (TIGR01784 family)